MAQFMTKLWISLLWLSCTTYVESWVPSPRFQLSHRSFIRTTTTAVWQRSGGDEDRNYNGNKKSHFFSHDSKRRLVLKQMVGGPTLIVFPRLTIASPSSKASSIAGDVDVEFSSAIQHLFNLDAPNRLLPGKDYVIETQGGFRKETNGEVDAAPSPLFRYVDPLVFQDRPTYRTFVALLDNYQSNVCVAEDDTDAEQNECKTFLKACMATPVMQFCFKYCKSRMMAKSASIDSSSTKNASTTRENFFETEEDFIKLLYKIWFKLYSRSRDCGDREGDETDAKNVRGSSGFEHVFVGEIRDGKVIGFHNWIQIYLQEKSGNVDYRGSISRGIDAVASTDRVLSYNLRWNGAEKYIGTSLIGVSPEFELALYTMAFLVGKKDNVVRVQLDDRLINLDIKCFKTKGKIGSCYVESL